jgi:hypothetical protein
MMTLVDQWVEHRQRLQVVVFEALMSHLSGDLQSPATQ